MTKTNKFFRQVEKVVNGHEQSYIKARIGDSLINNRTVTVNQLIRFLDESGIPGHKRLALNLRKVYASVVRRKLKLFRRAFQINRTDAYDLNEFRDVINLIYDSNLARQIGQLVK